MFFKPITTIKSKLDSIQVKAGNLIFCSDTSELFYDDNENNRKQISDFIYLNSELERESILAPIENKIYIVNNKMYRYLSSEWVSLGGGGGSLSQDDLKNIKIVTLTSTVSLSQDVNITPTNIADFSASDDLMVLCDGIYISPSYYQVTEDNKVQFLVQFDEEKEIDFIVKRVSLVQS